MRLLLWRGRNWRFEREQGGSPGTAADDLALSQQSSPAAARVRSARGTHRKPGLLRKRLRSTEVPTRDTSSAMPTTRATLAWPATGAGPATAAATPAGPAQAAERRQNPGPGSAHGAARAAIRIAIEPAGQVTTANIATLGDAPSARTAANTADARPWYATTRPGRVAPGRRNCGCLEQVLIREWAEDEEPATQVVTAVDRLAALPLLVKEKLAAGLDAIHIGSGGVPDLDDMGELAGVPLPSGRATWDACAGAYGERKIVVGSRPSPTPDVMCHEVGHALDDIDAPSGQWQSDSADFRALYGRCLPHIRSEFHRHRPALGRREFFADAFAAIASSQRPALVEMLSGETRTALDVMLYFNVRYGM